MGKKRHRWRTAEPRERPPAVSRSCDVAVCQDCGILRVSRPRAFAEYRRGSDYWSRATACPPTARDALVAAATRADIAWNSHARVCSRCTYGRAGCSEGRFLRAERQKADDALIRA